MPDFTKLLAIGLLNYADDHGYFWANPLMIRGALFPFEEDSSRILRALAQLEQEGYIKLGEASDGRSAGQVLKFKKHQRVDKPSDSEIQPLVNFDERSTNVPLLLQDHSCLEGKGKEGKGREIKEAPPPVLLPFDSDVFRAKWEEWLVSRTERKLKKLTPTSLKALFAKMSEWGEAGSIESMDTSMRNGWQGLFEPKTTSAAASHRPATAEEHIASSAGWGTPA